jgi:hypothetical protein
VNTARGARVACLRWPALVIAAAGAIGGACDTAHEPCVEWPADASATALAPTFWPDCLAHAAVALSNLTVQDAATDVPFWTVAALDDRAPIATIIYGQPPPHWTVEAGPDALVPGAAYWAHFTYRDGPARSVRFTGLP